MFISIGRNNQEKESLNWVVKNVSCLVIPKFSDCMAKLWHLSVQYQVYVIYLWLRAVLLLMICFQFYLWNHLFPQISSTCRYEMTENTGTFTWRRNMSTTCTIKLLQSSPKSHRRPGQMSAGFSKIYPLALWWLI